MVGQVGIEPTKDFSREILSLLRMPVPPLAPTERAIVRARRPRSDDRVRKPLPHRPIPVSLLRMVQGAVAEWLGSGLQIRSFRFDSGRRLHLLLAV